VPKQDRVPHTPPEEPPSPEAVLAAIERAARHRARETGEVPVWAITEHLDISRRSRSARRLRAHLEALESAGSLERSRRHGVAMWTLTAAGRRRLRTARTAGRVPELPEAPQHRAWRNARTAAAQEIERFGQSFGEQLDAAAGLLEAASPARSDALFEAGERIQRAAWRLASATHCLHEWSEPDDARADIDDHVEPGDERLDPSERARRRARRLGRRNITLWEDRR
jgi:hypothetical protein